MIAIPQEVGNSQGGIPEEHFRLEERIQYRTQLSFSSTCVLRTPPAKDPYPRESSGVETSQENRAGTELSVRMRQ